MTILYLSTLSYFSNFMGTSFFRLMSLCGESVILTVLLLIFILTREEREKIKSIICNKFKSL